MWQKEQEEALKTCQEYVKEFSKLTFIQPEHTVILDILYYQGYGNWNIFTKTKLLHQQVFIVDAFPDLKINLVNLKKKLFGQYMRH